jgi:hypothetical protein
VEVDDKVASSDSVSMSFISLNHDFAVGIVDWVQEFVTMGQAKGYEFVTVAECLGDTEMYRS